LYEKQSPAIYIERNLANKTVKVVAAVIHKDNLTKLTNRNLKGLCK